ncbi:MAG TPA: ATP-binding protein, partial [Candidatus Kapabacteria bacterium]|nr:ATP-binding protein [Candidatus Kapabacteria bacterium]
RRRMVADISHELRTPIATLRAQLEAIEDGVRPLNASAVQRLHEQVMRLSNLVHDLYELSLADIGALSYRKQLLDLRELTTTLVNSMQPQFAQAALELTVQDQCNGSLPVLGDQQRLTQLFANLLQNSLQYTTAPGQVRVHIRAEDQTAVICVEDSAPGVEKSVQSRLFERLFRAESSRNRNTGGAGLGLSLCQTIAEAHNGSIVATDSTLGGLAVTVRIPLTQVAS